MREDSQDSLPMGSWRSARLVLPIAGMAFLWLLSSIPVAADQTMVGVFIPKLLQKSMHVVAYASMTVAWLWALGSNGPRLSGPSH